jgi:hypothetical protein
LGNQIKFYLLSLFLISFSLTIELKAQPFIDPGIGFLYGKPGSAIRLNAGINNILLHRFGAYATIEYALTPESKFPVRDIFGGSLRLTQNISVFGGVGVFKNGILSRQYFKSARKEIGISKRFPALNIDVDFGYSFTTGQSINVGYIIPVRSAYFKPHGPPQEYEFPLTETYAQVDRDILRSLLGNITFNYGLGYGRLLSSGAETSAIVPANFLATYNFNQLRVGGGFYANLFDGSKVTTTNLVSRTKAFIYLGYDFAAFSNYSFTGDMQLGWFEKSASLDKSVLSYANAGVTIRYSLVNYLSLFVRPTLELREVPSRSTSAYISAGISLGLPGLAKCRIPLCKVQVNHGHGSREFRRNSLVRNVPSNNFGASPRLAQVKVKRVKPGK